MNSSLVGILFIVIVGYIACGNYASIRMRKLSSPLAYNVTIFLGGKKFDTVDGKLKLELVGKNISYPVALSANNEKLSYQKAYSYAFAAPYDITQINELKLSWTRKTSIGSFFTTKKIYVLNATLKPEYMLNPYIRSASIHKYCPKEIPEGIKPKEVLVLSQHCH